MAKTKSKTQKAAIKKSIRRKQPVHKRALLHPISLFGLLCVGVLIVGMTYNVIASNYEVTAVVPAPILTAGAIITSPANGYTSGTSPIIVKGSCPQNSYINLYRNGNFSGSAWCELGNTFSIETGLSVGINTMLAQDYNVTDQAGPATASVDVNYSPGAILKPAFLENNNQGQAEVLANETVITTGSQISRPGLPLLLTSDYTFRTFAKGSAFSWTLDIGGGRSPYKMHVDWGDKTVSNFSLNQDSVFTISHVYKTEGYYPVKVRVIDRGGGSTVLQLAALIKKPGSRGLAFAGSGNQGSASGKSGFLPNSDIFSRANHWLWLAWPTYAILVLMALSFILGERQEYGQIIAPRHTKRRRTA